MTIDEFPQVDSVLRRLDPRWKVVGLVVAMTATASLRSFLPAAAACVFCLTLVVLGRLPWRWLARRLSFVAAMVGPFVLLIPFIHGGPSSRLFSFSRAGFELAAMLSAKAIALTIFALVLLATTPFADVLNALRALGAPNLLVNLLALAYRYSFLLIEEFSRIRTALRVRGYRPGGRGGNFRMIGQVTGVLLVRSFERAERVHQAMCCRGFTGGQWRSLAPFQTHRGDVLFFTLVSLAAMAVWLWDYRGWIASWLNR